MRSLSVYALLVLATMALSLSLAASYREAKSHSKTWMKDASRTSMHVRRRRQVVSLAPAQIKEALGHHNTLRASEGADNMQLMVGL